MRDPKPTMLQQPAPPRALESARRRKTAAKSLTSALGASEQLFATLRQFTPTNVVRVVALEGPLGSHRLLRALRLLHARHPLLRARIRAGAAPHFAYDAAPPPAFVPMLRRGDAHWRSELVRLLNTSLEQAYGTHCALLYLHCSRTLRGELILALDHTLCDGVSINQLCAELLELCAEGVAQPVRPTLPVLEAMLPPYPATIRVMYFAKALAGLAGLNLLRRVYERRTPARGTAYLSAQLSASETRGLLARAQLQRTTLTGALMAALLRSARAVYRTPRLALSVPIDLRSRVPGQALSSEDLGNYTSVAYLTSSARAAPWELARTLRAQLERALQPDRLLSTVSSIYRWGRRLLGPKRPPSAHVMLSNSGVVLLRREYGRFRIRDFFSADSAPMLSADFAFFCNTFDGRLTLNLVYSERLASRAKAQEVLDRVRRHLTIMAT